MIRVAIQHEPIALAGELDAIADGAGAVASFCGHVRADEGVTSLELEHYPGATEAALVRLAEAATQRWGLLSVTIVHRIGAMAPGERIVLVAAAAPHRAAALDAVAFLIDRLKTDAPFWKCETRGVEARWVDGRAEDAAATDRWR